MNLTCLGIWTASLTSGIEGEMGVMDYLNQNVIYCQLLPFLILY